MPVVRMENIIGCQKVTHPSPQRAFNHLSEAVRHTFSILLFCHFHGVQIPRPSPLLGQPYLHISPKSGDILPPDTESPSSSSLSSPACYLHGTILIRRPDNPSRPSRYRPRRSPQEDGAHIYGSCPCSGYASVALCTFDCRPSHHATVFRSGRTVTPRSGSNPGLHTCPPYSSGLFTVLDVTASSVVSKGQRIHQIDPKNTSSIAH